MANRATAALDRWNTTVSNAEKIVTKKGKLPKPRKDPKAALTALVKIETSFETLLTQLLTKGREYALACELVAESCNDYRKVVDADDFGLSRTDKNEAKLIASASKVLDDTLMGFAKAAGATVGVLGKLDKALDDMMKLGA